ncbi:long-chain fatty acid--CoA ligase [Paenibacillus athensensis]|uniref:Long-chain fatty acid--CoA ligase n=1 Tax=Paenibacillus athensensis TaxID=1967502 RepID=A0A4Y8QCJ1_9BACL|nr:long-chain fatty acid--CoA ligase [Paenibacillus athensensis]MCD1257509.1 long-chain fatty acid--CoA ligase [Paenibacillus athensensis]
MEETGKIWLRHYPQEVASTYNYPKHNLARLLIDAAEKFPRRPALYFMGKKITYAALLELAYRFASGLASLGVARGERVAIMLPNCPSAVIAHFGALLAGAIVVQTNPLYKERELLHQLRDSGAVALVTLDQLYARVEGIRRQTALRHVLVAGIADDLPFPKSALYRLKLRKDGEKPPLIPDNDPGIVSLRKWLRAAAPTPACAEVDAERDIALLQYTGGTTGTAKGVMLTHYNLLANTYQNLSWFYRSREGRETYLGVLPIFHVFGLTVLLHQSVLSGAMLILLPRFETEPVLQTIARLQPTIFPGAPTMYIALIHHPRVKQYPLASIEVCVSGSAPLPQEVQERFEALTDGRLIEGYGLTEASPVTHVNPIWGRRKIGTIGIPTPDTDARIVDIETGETLPPGQIGELLVKGPQVMLGYWQRPEETAAVLKDGWLHTGDMASMDEDGYFTIVDRRKDLIIAGGFNIYPREVEEVLFEHPAVQEAAVAGVPDAYRGETVKAFIVVKPGMSLTEQDVIDWCRERLAAYKVPRLVAFRSSLPKTMIGKVLRRKLLEDESSVEPS